MQPHARRLLFLLFVATVLSLDFETIYKSVSKISEAVISHQKVVQESVSAFAQTIGAEVRHKSRKRSEVTTAEQEDDDVPTLQESSASVRAKLLLTLKNSCLPKLICELNAIPDKTQLSETEKSLLNIIRDTTFGTMAEVTSKYHFAAHMGQLLAGVEGNGCYNFYPSCPLGGRQVLEMMSRIKFVR